MIDEATLAERERIAKMADDFVVETQGVRTKIPEFAAAVRALSGIPEPTAPITEALAAQAREIAALRGAMDLDILLDAIASIRDEYSRLRTEALTQMELFASQGDSSETAQYSTEAERHGSSLSSANRILSIAEDFAKSARDAARAALEMSGGGCCED